MYPLGFGQSKDIALKLYSHKALFGGNESEVPIETAPQNIRSTGSCLSAWQIFHCLTGR